VAKANSMPAPVVDSNDVVAKTFPMKGAPYTN
jgi:hypothetical protein